MVSAEFSESISETIDILNHMDKTYINKIPNKFMEFLNTNKSSNYISHLDHSKSINEMELNERTKDLLAIIYMNYWCDDKQKSDYKVLLKDNEEKYQTELREKYNPDNIFKKNSDTQDSLHNNISTEVANENVEMVEYKESFLQKVINKIKSFFHSK